MRSVQPGRQPKTITVEYNPAKAAPQQLVQELQRRGYSAQVRIPVLHDKRAYFLSLSSPALQGRDCSAQVRIAMQSAIHTLCGTCLLRGAALRPGCQRQCAPSQHSPEPARCPADTGPVARTRWRKLHTSEKQSTLSPWPQVAPAAQQPAIVRLAVTGMTCGACSASVTKMLLQTEGISHASVSHATHAAEVHYAPGAVTPEEIREVIEDCGFDAAVQQESAAHSVRCAANVECMRCSGICQALCRHYAAGGRGVWRAVRLVSTW